MDQSLWRREDIALHYPFCKPILATPATVWTEIKPTKEVTTVKAFAWLVGIAGAVVAVERFYVHPTYGNGLRALVAAVQAGELFA
jgi:hypothetical protein